MTVTDFRGATPMFGRAADHAALLSVLSQKARVVTVTGRGGVGKTRLAVEVMRTLTEQTAIPIVGVALAGVTSPDLVIGEIVAAVGGSPAPNVAAIKTLVDRVGDDPILLVLDNFEHVLGAAPVLSEFVERCPNAQVLVTSQGPLRLQCEHVVALNPLPVPDSGEHDVKVLAGLGSVATYCERAAAVDRTFALHDGNAAAIAELCRVLEGLPLAIELAAARAAALPAAEILRLLDARGIGLLRRPHTDTPERHQDLRRAIEWTYDLLTPEEQQMLRRLSVISGTFDVDAALTLSATDASVESIDLLVALVDLHLVDPVPNTDPARFQIPSSIRAVAQAELDRNNERAVADAAHLAMRVTQARAAANEIHVVGEAVWIPQLQADHDDLFAALEHALEAKRASDAVTLADGFAPLWSQRGYFAAQEEVLERTLRLADEHAEESVAFADLLLWSCWLGLQKGATIDRESLLARLARGEALARALGDTRTVLRALAFRMLAVIYTGDIDAACTASAEGLELAARSGEGRWLGQIEAWSGMLETQLGNVDRAVELGRSALARARENGDPRTLVLATMMLMPLRHKHPEITPEMPPTEEVLECARAAGLTMYEWILLPMMVADAVAEGDAQQALRRAAESLAIARTVPGIRVAGYNLVMMAPVASLCGDHRTAAYFHGAVREHMEELARNMAPQQLKAQAASAAQTLERLGAEAFEIEAARGQRATQAEAIAAAIEYVDKTALRFEDPKDRAADAAPVEANLTSRQREVLALLVAGLGNREIADRLGISTKTAMHHTTAIYRALGMRGRAETIAFAIRAGLVN